MGIHLLRKEHVVSHLPTVALTLGALACVITFTLRIAISLQYFNLVFSDTCRDNIMCQGDDKLAAKVQHSPHPLSFGSLSIDFTRWTRLSHYSGAAWDTRFSQLWMLPKFFLSDKNFTRENIWILDYVANAFAEDMNSRKPDVMFVDDTDVFYTAIKPVNLVAYFSANPHFREAWSHYRFVHNINLCGLPPPTHKLKCSYDAYRRVSME